MDIIDKICDESEFTESIFSYSAEELKTSPVRNYFVGKVIFLTGTTGFLGQLYLEKLLRCDVERVFILARGKKDQPAKERLKQIVDGVVRFKALVPRTTSNNTSSLFLYKYLSIFYHLIPTVFFDFMLFLKGNKERIMPLIRKISEFTVSVGYFRYNEWIMDNSNMRNIINRMSPIDNELFLCDARILNHTLDDWLLLYTIGLRKYVVKETSLETKKSTYTKYKVMNFIQIFVRIGFYATQLLLIYALAKGLGIVKAIFG